MNNLPKHLEGYENGEYVDLELEERDQNEWDNDCNFGYGLFHESKIIEGEKI